jgi:hypothetical protein
MNMIRLKCNRKLFVFAPVGRNVYSLAILFLLLSSEGAERVSLLWSEDFVCALIAINISLRWSESETKVAL